MRRSRFIFLAPSFFLGLDGYSFCAYWYLLTARGRERAGEGQGTTRRGGAAGGVVSRSSRVGIQQRRGTGRVKTRTGGGDARHDIADEEERHDEGDDPEDQVRGVGLRRGHRRCADQFLTRHQFGVESKHALIS